MQGEIEGALAKFCVQEDVVRKDLISEDWSAILDRMRVYKRVRFPDDTRFITLCAYTPRGTLRVEFR